MLRAVFVYETYTRITGRRWKLINKTCVVFNYWKILETWKAYNNLFNQIITFKRLNVAMSTFWWKIKSVKNTFGKRSENLQRAFGKNVWYWKCSSHQSHATYPHSLYIILYILPTQPLSKLITNYFSSYCYEFYNKYIEFFYFKWIIHYSTGSALVTHKQVITKIIFMCRNNEQCTAYNIFCIFSVLNQFVQKLITHQCHNDNVRVHSTVCTKEFSLFHSKKRGKNVHFVLI